MNKRNWIILGIGVAVIIAVLAIIKTLPFWATILSLGSYAAGIISYWIVKKFVPIQ